MIADDIPGFARAQAAYDAQEPDYHECCDKCHMTQAAWDDEHQAGGHHFIRKDVGEGQDCDRCDEQEPPCTKTDDRCPCNKVVECQNGDGLDRCDCHCSARELRDRYAEDY